MIPKSDIPIFQSEQEANKFFQLRNQAEQEAESLYPLEEEETAFDMEWNDAQLGRRIDYINLIMTLRSAG